MITNRRFSFENYIGKYEIIPVYDSKNVKPDDPAYKELIASADEGYIELTFTSINIEKVNCQFFIFGIPAV